MSLKGSLSTIALPEVLQFLAGTAKSGELQITSRSVEGRLWLETGRLRAHSVGVTQEPADAIFELMRAEDGEFEFSADVPVDPDAHRLGDGEDVEPAIEQARRRFEEWSSIVAVVPSARHRIELVEEVEGPLTLSGGEWSMIASVGDGRSVAELLERRQMSEFEGCRSIRDLVEAGLVRVGEPVADESADEKPVVDEQAAVDEPAGEEPAAEAHADDKAVAVEAPPGEVVEDGKGNDDDESAPVAEKSFEEHAETPAGGDEPAGSGHSPSKDLPAEDRLGLTSLPVFGFARPEAVPAAAVLDPESSDTAADASDGGVVDRWAALKAVVEEVDDSVAAGPFDDEDLQADDDLDGPFLRPLPVPDHVRATPEPAEAPSSGRAALAALLAEVSSLPVEDDDTAVPAAADPAVDGLADRGPWTAGELAAFDGWSEGHMSDDDDVVAADTEPAEAVDEAELVSAPVEEPINRGLLLKFLSSVRN